MAVVKARGLAKVQVKLENPETAAMVLTDLRNKHSGYLFGPEGLEVLLEALLPLLHTWSEHPELNKDRISGRGHPIPATRIVIQDGRSADEAAVFVEIGSASLVFLVPRVKVSATFAVQPHSVTPNKGESIH
ncbi:MAG: hypothetical protein O7D27_02635 [Alphaproteobacteria bacterium]|nr:hypothetical protein [Alphaproteobacteria bacterium]